MAQDKQLKIYLDKTGTECESDLWVNDYTLFGAHSIEEALAIAKAPKAIKGKRGYGFYELPYEEGKPFLTVSGNKDVKVNTSDQQNGDNPIITVYQFYSQTYGRAVFDEQLLQALQEQGTLPDKPINGEANDIVLIVESADKAKERKEAVYDICNKCDQYNQRLEIYDVSIAKGRILQMKPAALWLD
ncbi:hypothetical protein KY366_00090 [Candidatus Woesearchaeota archaeon]|nr:hypothetical protein [Candidatus Woesearchaeota archaeon]